MSASPLDLAHDSIKDAYTNIGAEPKIDGSSFDLVIKYPPKGIEKRPPKDYEVRIAWQESINALIIVGAIKGAYFLPWGGMDKFLQIAGDGARIFLDDPTYEGRLIAVPYVEGEKQLLAPAYRVYLGLKGAKEEEVKQAVPGAINTILRLLYLAHPLFHSVAVTGHEPDAVEMLRSLSREYGYYELSRIPADVEEEEYKSETKRLFFPRGMGGEEIGPQ